VKAGSLAAARRTRPGAAAIVRAQARPVDVDRINHVNIGLMLFSAALAFTIPFEIFLLAYAVLGPLHYLTQISWLHDRGYFTTGRFDWIPLAGLGAVAWFAAYTPWLPWTGSAFAAFGAGVVAAFVPNLALKLASVAVFAALALPVQGWTVAAIIFTQLLVTVIHVYVFTGVFILAGSMKSRSRSGFLSLAVFLACGLGLLLWHPSSTWYRFGPYTQSSLQEFKDLITATMRLLPNDATRDGFVAVGRFLAFAYTYHYLNWFSKTGIIRWHEMSPRRMGAIGTVYALSLACYGYDYKLGLMMLFFLSVTHVFLEFPLDARTLVEVVTGLRRLRTAPS
jgi:hypothetical protein